MSLAYRIGQGPLNTDGVYAVILREDGVIHAISKHPCGPRNSGNMEQFRREIILYAQAAVYPPFNRDDFGHWDCFIENSWEDEIISDAALADILRKA
jgi:hypothetical protein